MSHKMLRPCIVKVSVLGYFPLHLHIHMYSMTMYFKHTLYGILIGMYTMYTL